MATGVFFDGRSARRRTVQVALGGTRLDIRDERGAPLAQWPLERLTAQEETGPGGGVRLTSADEPEARLILDDAALIARLEYLAPRLRRRQSSWSVTWLRVAGIAVLAGAIGLVAVYAMPSVSRPLARLVPLEWERELGTAVTETVLQGARICAAPAGQAALERLVGRLTAVIELPYAATVSVAVLPEENAFAAPGGTVVIGRALIDRMAGPDELAGVLAHELGHVAERHPTASAIRMFGLSLLFDLMVGGDSGVADFLAQGAGLLLGLSYSRDDEREADRIALDALTKAGIRPDGIARLFARLSERFGKPEKGRLGEPLVWISTHPGFAERIARARVAGADSYAPALAEPDWQAVRAICG